MAEVRKNVVSIRVATTAGVCFGVERALNLSERALKELTGPISSVGPIIHNPQTVENLSSRGLKVAKNIAEAEGTVVFRSHGVSLQTQREAAAKGLKIVDATCPLVKVPQNFARKLSAAGYFVVLVGDELHPEIDGVKSYVENGEIAVIRGASDVESLPAKEKVGIICQTTLKKSVFDEVVDACKKKFPEVKVHNTICSATKDRQEAAYELAREVDCMVVIGGRNSSNTQKLFDICKELTPDTYLVETPDEIKKSWFESVTSVGITAGASTPQKLIEDVHSCIASLTK